MPEAFGIGAVGGALSTSGGVLRVSTEVMRQKATEAAGQLAAMRNSFSTMRSLISGSAAYWQGEAGDLHRARYEQCAQKAEAIFRRLQEHISDLNQMASAYEGAERAVQTGVEPLSSDVIV